MLFGCFLLACWNCSNIQFNVIRFTDASSEIWCKLQLHILLAQLEIFHIIKLQQFSLWNQYFTIKINSKKRFFSHLRLLVCCLLFSEKHIWICIYKSYLDFFAYFNEWYCGEGFVVLAYWKKRKRQNLQFSHLLRCHCRHANVQCKIWQTKGNHWLVTSKAFIGKRCANIFVSEKEGRKIFFVSSIDFCYVFLKRRVFTELVKKLDNAE